MERRGKWVVALLMAASLVFALILLQQQFDEGDMRRAVEMLSVKQPQESRSIGEELIQRAGSKPLDCKAKLLSSFAGTLQVRCVIADEPPYLFNVDLVRKQVNPGNDVSSQLLASIRAQ
jgi:hypothetical protein